MTGPVKMTPLEASQFIKTALEHHRAGRVVEAEAMYRQVLSAIPNDLDALHLLGVLLGQTGRGEAGIELVAKACALSPNSSSLFASFGNLLRDGGQTARAIAAYLRAIQLDPNSAETHNNLGNAFLDQQRFGEAEQAYRAALRLNPGLDRAWSNLGVVYRLAGKGSEAVAAFRKAIELGPHSSIAHDNLGIALREDGQLDASLVAHQRAVELQPNSAIIHNHLSVALKAMGRLDDAVAASLTAVALDPNDADAYCTLGSGLAELDRVDDAIAAFRKAIALRPEFGGAWTNLGMSLGDKGSFAQSLEACQKAADVDPADPIMHLNLGVALLRMGAFERGWVEYEWRWLCTSVYPPRPFNQPRWDGRPLEGKTIFLHADQGLGDTLQFIRYVPLVCGRGGRVLLGCDAPLRRLLESAPGIERIFSDGENIAAFDVHCPVASLPAIFATTAETIPAHVPYLRAKPRLAEEWRRKLAPFAGQYKVGLVWAGRPAHRNDKNRSLALAQLAPLAADGITFFSLQKGAAAAQADNPPAAMRLFDMTNDLFDMADTAGLIENLDLVISVDTSVAHLAGAMGKPVWTLLPLNPDWRWMLEREDSPWYPTMRLFRQRTAGEWE